jgi:hypothetical protein
VLLTWREPDYIAGPDLLDGSAFPLNPAAAGADDKSLAFGHDVGRAELACELLTRFILVLTA